MENAKNEISAFKKFADKKIAEHKAELSSKYEGKKMPTQELRQKAINEHKSLFEQELKEETKKLTAKLNRKGEVTDELNTLCTAYIRTSSCWRKDIIKKREH